ncbi:MAG: ABC transporter substrate-binding protein [Micromonosporaceae bacterium]
MKSPIAGVAVLLAACLSTAACGAQGGGESDSGTLRISWFGNDVRNAAIQKAIKEFEKQNSHIKVKTEYTPFDSYADKLATQFAANDAPDMVMLDETRLGEYADRGALLDLGDSIDTSKFDANAASAGETADGAFGITAGLNAMAILANPELFKKAGVELPDDGQWTWDDYSKVAAEVTENSAKGVYGSAAPNFGPGLELWLRQQGKSVYTNDGKLGYTAADAAPYFTYLKSLGADKAIPPASVIVEGQQGLEQSGSATNKAALGWFWNSALGPVNTASGQEMTVLRPPSEAGDASSAGLFYKADSLWAVNARSEKAAAAKKLIDFLVNSPDAGKHLLTNVGVPANSEVRAALEGKLDPSSEASSAYIDKISSELGPKRPTIPAGGGVFDATIGRVALDVLFGKQTPEEAAEKLVSEMSTAIKG